MNTQANRISIKKFRILAGIGHGTNDLYWMILPIVLPLMLSQYELRYAGGGTVLSIYLMVVALSSLFAGRLSDKLHRWRLIGLSFLLASAGFGAAAFSATLPLFVLSLIVAAVGVSAFHPTMYGLIADALESEHARFYGEFESWGAMTLTAMFVAAGLLLPIIGWKSVILMVAVPGMAVGMIFLRVWAPSPPGRTPDPTSQETGSPALVFAAFMTSNMLRFFAISGILSFLPTFLVFQIELAPGTAAFAGALFFGGGILGNRIGGLLAGRHSPYRVMTAGLFLVVPLVFLLGSLSWVPGLVIVIFLLGISAMICLPAQSVILRSLGGQMGSGQAFGILMAGLTITQALGPAVFGVMADAVGLPTTMQLFALPALAALALVLAVGRSARARATAAVTSV